MPMPPLEPSLDTLNVSSRSNDHLDMEKAVKRFSEPSLNASSGLKDLLDAEKAAARSSIHSFHRYFGKLIPAIPAFAIKHFTRPGEWVCDPFVGSGTTLVEARLSNRNGLGLEINPISCFIAKVKTTPLDTELLAGLNEQLCGDIEADTAEAAPEEIPYCINREHWFKPFVQQDLVRIKRCIDGLFARHRTGLPEGEQRDVVDFYRLVLSSIIRNVSNADTQHVFPGYSKRLRSLDAEGKRKIHVLNSFKAALRKKTKALGEYEGLLHADGDGRQEQDAVRQGAAHDDGWLRWRQQQQGQVIIDNVDSRFVEAERYPKARLIVTNPPYISSIRYIETLKLELYWMEYILDSGQYRSLEKRMMGSDRLGRKEYDEPLFTPYEFINDLVARVYGLDAKSGNVVGRYFNEMTDVIRNMNRLLCLGGHVVMKISDSKVKKVKIETGAFLTEIARLFGFEPVETFIDKIENRSLLTARNSYSDIITHDYIVVWRKSAELR